MGHIINIFFKLCMSIWYSGSRENINVYMVFFRSKYKKEIKGQQTLKHEERQSIKNKK